MKRTLPIGVAILILGLWAALATRYPAVLLPSPLEVVVAMANAPMELLTATAITGLSSLLGLVIALGVGLTGAIAFQRFSWLEWALYPYALALQTVPIIIIAPLLVVWLGYGMPVAIATAALLAFFPILTGVNLGLRSVPAEQLELFRIHGATPRQELRLLRLPHALPYLFTGLRTAVGLSVIGAVVGEFVGSFGRPPSLGGIAMSSIRGARTEASFASIILATALALGFFALVRLAERRMIGSWHPGGNT
ncbi:MAG: ABC transporter permease [Myxococcota bacterium]|nr:ABC transporter permease [Myxococcota bacterium]